MRPRGHRRKIRRLKEALTAMLDKYPNDQLLDDIDDDELSGKRIVMTLPDNHFLIRDIRLFRKILSES